MVNEKHQLTLTNYTNLFNMVNTAHFASKQVPLFGIKNPSVSDINDGCISFNKNNWNSGQDILRYIATGLHEDFGDTLYQFRTEDNKEVSLRVKFYNDEWTCYVEIINKHKYDMYIEGWYKSRGSTDVITHNGRLIDDVNDYINLVNILLSDNMLYGYVAHIIYNVKSYELQNK